MEFWRGTLADNSGAVVSFVSERGCLREWVDWHLRRGALWGLVSVSGVVSSVSALPSVVWRPVWHFRRDSGSVIWRQL